MFAQVYHQNMAFPTKVPPSFRYLSDLTRDITVADLTRDITVADLTRDITVADLTRDITVADLTGDITVMKLQDLLGSHRATQKVDPVAAAKKELKAAE